MKKLSVEDVLTCRHAEDAIARVGYSIDMHDPDGKGIRFGMQEDRDESYDIPYGCLVPRDLDGVIAAGRCISAEHEALASCRVMVFCMGMGEAAGYAAALSAQTGKSLKEIDLKQVQSLLRQTGAI